VSAPASGPVPYRVVYSERVRQRLLALADVACGRGDGEAYLAAAFGVPLQVGDAVRIRDGTFVGQVGQVVGYHWRPGYPKVRLTAFGRPLETWFQSHQLERQQRREGN
jgi:transcription antitermination factor NusG